MKFKKGQTAYVKNVGYGLVSFEGFKVEAVRGDKVKLADLNTWYDAKTGSGDGESLGLEVRLCVADADIKRAQKECAE